MSSNGDPIFNKHIHNSSLDSFEDENSATKKFIKHEKEASEFFFEYSKLLSGVSVKEYLTKYKEELKASKISFNERCFQSEMSLVIIKHTENYDIVTLFVSFSHFSFEISVVNLLDESPSQTDLQMLGKGENDKIYHTRIDEKNIAIKSIFCCDTLVDSEEEEANRNEASNIIFKATFEYCMCKLFSVFEIGPKIINIFAFDLIIYKNTIEFSMEKCEKHHHKNLESLYSSLSIMHSFGLIHGDIKPNNIMWSPSFNKWVLKDFGFSQVLQEKPGEKTLRKNFETFQNISKEMNNFFHSSNSEFVDLYFYDLNCLKVVIDGVIDRVFDLENVILKEKISSRMSYYNFIMNIQVCKSLYESNNFQKDFYELRNSVTILESFKKIIKNIYDQKIEERYPLYRKLYTLENGRNSSSKYFFTQSVNFLWRFKQRVTNFNGAIDDLMLFSLIYKKFDITPNRYCEKEALITKINSEFEPSNQECWKNLVELLKNPYITFIEVTSVLDNVREKFGIKDEIKFIVDEEFELLSKGNQIASVCIEKYGFNLIELNSAYSFSTLEKIKTKIISNEFSDLIELHSNEFPYLEFLNSLQNEHNDDEFISHSVANMQTIIEKYKIKELPICMKLFQSALKIELSYNNFETICRVFEAFRIYFAMDLLKNSNEQIKQKDLYESEKYKNCFGTIFTAENIVSAFMFEKCEKFSKELKTYDFFKWLIQNYHETFEKLIPCNQNREYLFLYYLSYFFNNPEIYLSHSFYEMWLQIVDTNLKKKITDENLIMIICRYLIEFKTIKPKKARILELFENVELKPTGNTWNYKKMEILLEILEEEELKEYTKTEIKRFMEIQSEEEKFQLFYFTQISILFQKHILLNQSLQSKEETKAQIEMLLKYAYHENGNIEFFPTVLETMAIFYNGLEESFGEEFIELILRGTNFQNKKNIEDSEREKYEIADNAIKYFLKISNKENKYSEFKNAVFSFAQKGIISEQRMFFIKNGNFIIFLETILRYLFDGTLELDSSEVIWVLRIASQLINKSDDAFSRIFFQAISSEALFLKEKCNILSSFRNKKVIEFRSIRNPHFDQNYFNNLLRNIEIKEKEQLRIPLVKKINNKFKAKLNSVFAVNEVNLFIDDEI